jgi:flagellar biosynthesis/type III secretory pathway M-ring protein FliF/YscJ
MNDNNRVSWMWKQFYTIGVNMDKWKELGKRKKFWIAVGVIAVIAVIGWVSGWWASPESVV